MALERRAALGRRRLGSTDMEITRVGFGAWALGGGGWAFAWGGQDDQRSIDAIRHAVRSGVNWIDTAAVYGLGHSEEVVARALEGMSDSERPYVFTKGGLVWDERDRSRPALRLGRPDSLRREIDDSLRRLHTDRVDLYQMHWPAEDGTPIEEYWGVLLDLKQQGKARAVGVSNHGVPQLERAERLGHVDSLQPPLSLIDRQAAADVIPWCRRHGTGVIVYSPMQSGLLSGAFTEERARQLPDDDWRSRDPEFHGERLQHNLAMVERLRPIAARQGVTVAEVAIAWTLCWPGVTAAIVGARNPEQVDGWLGAASVHLGEQEMNEIAAAAAASGEGPTRPDGGG